jgi:hypothetical protein
LAEIKALTPGEITDIRNMLSLLYTSGDMALRNDLPKLVSIDIPFAGAGAEVSLHYLGGIITIGELRHPEQQKGPEPSGIRRGSM